MTTLYCVVDEVVYKSDFVDLGASASMTWIEVTDPAERCRVLQSRVMSWESICPAFEMAREAWEAD